MEPGADVPFLQFGHEVVPVDLRGVHPDHEQVPGVDEVVASRIGQDPYFRDFREKFPVSHGQHTPAAVQLFDALELTQAQGRLHVGEIVLESGRKDLRLRRTSPVLPVEGVHADAVEFPAAHGVGQFFVGSDEHAALAAGDVLDGVEGVEGVFRADVASLVKGAQSVGRVLENGDLPRRLIDGVQIQGGSGEVDRNDQFRPFRDGRGDGFGPDQQGVSVHVHEDRLRPRQSDHVGDGDPGHGRGDDLIPRPDAQDLQKKVHSRRGAGKGHAEAVAREGGHGRLEFGAYGTVGDPAGAQDGGDGGDIVFIHRRTGERQKFFSHRFVPSFRFTFSLA